MPAPSKGCIPTDCIVNKLRELGFKFKKQQEKTMLYGRGSDGSRVNVPRRDDVSEAWIRSQFRMLGISDAEIETFLGQCR